VQTPHGGSRGGAEHAERNNPIHNLREALI
jgi:hypothetical protein